MVSFTVLAYSFALSLDQQQQGRFGSEECVNITPSIRKCVQFPTLPYHSSSLPHRHGELELKLCRNPSPTFITTLCEQGKLSAALDALPLLLDSPSDDVYFALLRSCNRFQDANSAKRVQGHLLRQNVDITGPLGNQLVLTLARCGLIEEALHVFHHIHCRSLSTWAVLMSACNQCKQSERVFDLYALMQEEGVEPDCHAYASLFKACSTLRNLEVGKNLHAQARSKGVAFGVHMNNSLVNMYGKCGDIERAECVFGAMQERSLTTWTSMLSAYVDVGQGEKALQLYSLMLKENICPNQHTLAVAIQACCILFDKRKINRTSLDFLCLEIGQALHADAQQSRYVSNPFVSTGLVQMYGRIGQVQEAEDVFASVSQVDSILCNAMLCAYIEHGHGEWALKFFKHMLTQGVSPNQKTFVLVVQACGVLAESEESVVVEGRLIKVKSFEICQALRKDAQRWGFSSNAFLRTTLLGVYAKCGVIEEAEKVFDEFDKADVVSWTAMISAYVEHSKEETALKLFRQMQDEGICANTQTFVVVVHACASLGHKAENPADWELPLEIGIALHADARKKGLASNVILNTALLGMYGMCGNIYKAEIVFNTMLHRDLVAWNAMLNAYAEQDEVKAFHMYRKMLQEGMVPNEKTYVSVLQACGTLSEKEEVIYLPSLLSALHDDVQKRGFSPNTFIGNTLVSAYGIMGYLEEAEKAFDKLSRYQIAPLNAMLSTYVQHDQGEKALQLYSSMVVEGTAVNDITLVCMLQACSQTGNFELCKQIHFSIVCAGYELNSSLASAFIRAYGNCGSMHDAQAVFDSLPDPDVVSWNVSLAGYAGEGRYESSMHALVGMQLAGIKPDAVTLTSLLSACSHGGFVTEGLEYFESICMDFDILPSSRHFSSITDVLGRAGDLECLETVLRSFPMDVDQNVWLPLLGACCLHGNAELAKQAFCQALSLQLEDASTFVIMSNIYADLALHEFTIEDEYFE